LFAQETVKILILRTTQTGSYRGVRPRAFITPEEVEGIKHLALTPEYRQLPLCALARNAPRIGQVLAFHGARAKPVHRHGWRRQR